MIACFRCPVSHAYHLGTHTQVYASGTTPEVSYVYHLAKPAPSPSNNSAFPEDTNLAIGPGHVHNVNPPEEEEEGRDIAWGYGDFSACSVTCGIG